MPTYQAILDKQIKVQCPIADPSIVYKPTFKYKQFYDKFVNNGGLTEGKRTSVLDMWSFAGIPTTVLPVYTQKQCSDRSKNLQHYIQKLRDDLAKSGLYIAKDTKEFITFFRKDNILAIKKRNRAAMKAFFRNDILMSNMKVADLPDKVLRMSDNNQFIVDINKWT